LDDGFDGVVVRLDHPAFQSVDWFGHEVVVGAGVELMSFSKSCSSMGWSGLEGMAGIPATIGGAVRMNAGGRWGDFGDVVKEVAVLNEDGIEETWNRDRIGFAYRKTNLGRAVVLSARLSLNKDDPERTLERYKDYFLRKRETQPLVERSAGCIFKNPSGQAAGALIDQAGLKGTRVGGAAVSKRHANFIVADSAARSSDVVRLIDLIRDRIRNLFGLTLETEIDIWSSRDRQSVN
jgi:UDP-N-acetylmuramate dehydrogenase